QGVAHASLPGRLSPSVVLAWGLVRPPVSASGTVGSLPSALRAVGLRPWWSPRRLLVVDALCSQRNHRANCTRLSSRNHAANVARLVLRHLSPTGRRPVGGFMSSAACPFSSRHRCALWALRAAPIARTLRQLDLRSSQRSASPRARVAYRVPTCPLPRTRDLLVVRRLRGRGSAARASLQVAVRWALLIARVVGRRPLPGIRHVLFAYADGRSFRCGSRGSRAPLRGVGASRRRLRRRCGARRGGSVTRSGIETVAERRRFAQRTVRGRSPLRRLCLSIPAASDDLTKHAGSTAPTRRSHRGYTGRYKCEAIRLDAP